MYQNAQERVHEEAVWSLRVERSAEILRRLVETYRAEGIQIGVDGRVVDSASGHYDEEFLARKRSQELKQEGSQFEILLLGLFQKFLGTDFVIVRSSRGDDTDGLDTMLVDRKSGDVVCAFDEIVQREVHDVGDTRKETKGQRILDKNRQGGATLVHGLRKSEEGFTIAKIEGVPVYVLSATSEKVERGLLEFHGEGEPTFFERQMFFNSLVRQLQQQNRQLAADERIPTPLRQKAAAFEDRLEEIKQEWYSRMNPETELHQTYA